MFELERRRRVRGHVLALATVDARVVAAAEVGPLAAGGGDRWSDLDLTFAVADGTPLSDALADWTRELTGELEAAHLFDLPRESTVYRVFLLPGCLQVDLSFTPASEFGARGPRFALLFGRAVERPHLPRAISSGSACTTRCAPASASSAAGSGRRSTGSPLFATRRSRSPVAGVPSTRRKGGASSPTWG